MTTTPRFSATFIFAVKSLDADFHALNNEIAARAQRIPGFLGEESRHNEDIRLHAEVYHWSHMDSLHRLVAMDIHGPAKRRYGEWLGEDRVVISEAGSVYGDPSLGPEHAPAKE